MATVQDKLDQAYALDNLAKKSFLKPDARLDYALSNSAANGLPNITITPTQGQYLAIQCQLMKAKSVLEVGTLGGYSTIWFASTGAKVTSIEINPKHRDVALENTKGLDVDIILGAALDVLPKLAAEGKKFDFIFLDAAWEEQWKYFEWGMKLASANGCIYVDNVVRNVLEEKDESVFERISREDKIKATLVPTVSSHKGLAEEMIDGFILAIMQ